MLGSSALLIPGIFVLTLGFTLQAGATGAVRAIKMSATLTADASRRVCLLERDHSRFQPNDGP
jgi:hypothetical protein